MTREIQIGLFGRALDTKIASDPLPDYRTFAYPAFTDLLFWPVARVPFRILRSILAVFLGGVTAMSVLLWLRAMSWRISGSWLAIVLLLTLGSYPVLEGLYAGQLGLLVGLLLAGSLLALQKGRFLLAGVLLALTAIKPQMTLLAGFYLIVWSLYDWRKRVRFLVGLFCALAIWVSASLVLWPHWIPNWIHVVAGYHRYAEPVLASEVLASPLGPTAAGPAAFVIIMLLLIAGMTLARRNRSASSDSLEFWFTLSTLLAITTVSLLPGQAVHDHVILLPGIFLLARRGWTAASSWTMRVLLIVGVAMLLWPYPASLCVIALRPFLDDQHFFTKAVLGLPLRTAGMFPFMVLGLLALAGRHLQPAREADGGSIFR
jgi:hypothetical protein